MGKIFDALERRKKEKTIKAEMLPLGRTKRNQRDDTGTLPAEESILQKGSNPKLVVISAPDSIDAENFKTLRAQLLFPKNGQRKRVIMVTSVFPGEGKTFVAANLGASIAHGINEHVLVMDCDFRKPHLHEIMGYANAEGLHEYLTGKRELNDLLIQTRVEKLSLLTAGGPSKNPSELLASNEMKDFLVEVKERYNDRFIIVDAAPLQVTSEASVLSNYVDGVLFVVMAGKTPRETIKKSIEKMGREKIIGLVFNGYDQQIKRYGYYYREYYK